MLLGLDDDWKVEEVALETLFTYDHCGRQVEVDAPQSLDATGAALNNITSTSYYPSDSVKEVFGQQAYPVSYIYDYAGRMLTNTTSLAAGNSTTRRVYSTSTGRLTGKLYNWTDDATVNEYGPSYTYTAAGRLLTRSWARVVSGTTKVTATYGYTRGLLTSVSRGEPPTPCATGAAVSKRCGGNVGRMTRYAMCAAFTIRRIPVDDCSNPKDERSKPFPNQASGFRPATQSRFGFPWVARRVKRKPDEIRSTTIQPFRESRSGARVGAPEFHPRHRSSRGSFRKRTKIEKIG